MEIGELMDLEMYGSMYLLFAMAFFYVEGANLLVPSRVNFNFKRILSPFASFFKGFIGAGGWNHYASVIFGHKDFVQLNDGASVWDVRFPPLSDTRGKPCAAAQP